MEILSEKEEKVVKWELDLSKDEEKLLISYATDNMPKETKRNFLMEWALIDLIKKYIEEETSSKKKKPKK